MTAITGPIEHVVVLMMENHSFDHMLGWLPGIGELDGTQSNQAGDQTYPVTQGAGYTISPSPSHDLADVNMQLFGTVTPASGATPLMASFAQDYLQSVSEPPVCGDPNLLMQCYAPGEVPVISALAQNFTVCTRWFCSVPGPTGPNRLYANCASSMGYAGPAYDYGSFPQELSSLTSIFGALTKGGLSWAVYHQDSDFAPELILNDVNSVPGSMCPDPNFTTFLSHVLTGQLPSYSFLTPSLWTNSQHPSGDIRCGECTIADVYEAIANSAYWENTLLVLTYDEHGGFYDSVPTPITGVQNPDGKNWDGTPPFAFDRLGPRVPAILISPYVQATVDTTQYEHSSIPATILKLFGLSWPDSNKRIQSVNTFESQIGSTLREGLPKHLLRPDCPPTCQVPGAATLM